MSFAGYSTTVTGLGFRVQDFGFRVLESYLGLQGTVLIHNHSGPYIGLSMIWPRASNESSLIVGLG